jgi:hypothetical protein
MEEQFKGVRMTLDISDKLVEFDNQIQATIAAGVLEATVIHWPVINWDEEM